MVHTDGKPTISCAVVREQLDISVRNEGTILLLRGESDAGRTWLDESLDPEAQRWGSAYVVEHRYVYDIIDGALGDGLAVGAA